MCLIPLAVLLVAFSRGTPIASATVPLVIGALIYIVIAGIFVAAVCGYMAGLIGSSNSPVSGLAILTVLGASLLLVALAHPGDPNAAKALVAFALFVTAIVINIATISNDNLQDLKTGQLVGATPWRQQVALVIGVVFGALVIPPILDLLNHAYGFTGSPMHGMTAQPLAAPQATLISALANGVITGQLHVGLDRLRRADRPGDGRDRRDPAPHRAPPVPAARRRAGDLPADGGDDHGRRRRVHRRVLQLVGRDEPERRAAKRLGMLLASGLIVGESLFGVILSGIIVVEQEGRPARPRRRRFQTIANWIGSSPSSSSSSGSTAGSEGLAPHSQSTELTRRTRCPTSAEAATAQTRHPSLEAFSDIIIGFSLAELTLSLVIPVHALDFFARPLGLIAFLVTFVLVVRFWWLHFVIFEHYFEPNG